MTWQARQCSRRSVAVDRRLRRARRLGPIPVDNPHGPCVSSPHLRPRDRARSDKGDPQMDRRRLRPGIAWIALLCLALVLVWTGAARAQASPEGQLTIAFDVSIAPTFLEPAETP